MISDFALKEIWRRKKKYLLNIMVIALVVVLLITLNSLGIAFKEAAKLPFENIHSSIIVQRNGNVPENISGSVTPCSLAPIKGELIPGINKLDGVKGVSYGLFLWVFDKDSFKRVLGVNWNDSQGKMIGSKIIEGSLPKSATEALVERAYSRQYGLKPGQKTNISGTAYVISGIVETSGTDIVSSDAYINLNSAQSLAYNSKNLQDTEKFNSSDVNIIFVDADQTKVRDVAGNLKKLLSPPASNAGKTPTGQAMGAFSIYTPDSFESQISSLFMISDRLTLIISLITLIGALLVIIKSMSHTLLERRKEFSIMKAVGFTSKDIQTEVTAETLLQAIIGYCAGIIMSLAVIFILSKTTVSIAIPWELSPYPHFLTSNPNLIAPVQTYPFPIRFEALYSLEVLLAVLLISLLTVLVLTRYISGLNAMEVLRYE
ncbi:MAG: ABC transporter permease [Methanotrichaceae archaeon]|nr:ABC transporter permease [Methanotrichaceae archaeon]